MQGYLLLMATSSLTALLMTAGGANEGVAVDRSGAADRSSEAGPYRSALCQSFIASASDHADAGRAEASFCWTCPGRRRYRTLGSNEPLPSTGDVTLYALRRKHRHGAVGRRELWCRDQPPRQPGPGAALVREP